MTTKHITDYEIQQYVLDKTNCRPNIIEHISACDTCRAQAETYQLIFSEIKHQEKPAFNFDLPGLVAATIIHEKTPVSQSNGHFWIPVLIGLSLTGITLYFFWNVSG